MTDVGIWIIVNWFTPDRIIAVATAVYALVTVVMFFAILSQARAAHLQADIMREQIQAMERSLALQEVALRQWISIENWRGQLVSQNGERKLVFSFDIVNPTKFPLTLDCITVNTYGCGSQMKANYVLAPGKKFIDRSWPTGPLSKEQGVSYDEAKLSVIVKCAVTYQDVFDKQRIQYFNVTCFCSAHSEIFFYPYAGSEDEWLQH
jgi:hypothetical protein